MVLKMLSQSLLLAVLVVCITQIADGRICNGLCRCRIQRNCGGTVAVHYDFMPNEWQVRIVGRRHVLNPENYCEDQCLNLLKTALGTPFDHTMVMKPDVFSGMEDIGYHRLCQLIDASRTGCTFTLQYGDTCQGGLQDKNIGTVGCASLTHAGDGSGDTISLKLGLDNADQTFYTMTASDIATLTGTAITTTAS